MNFQWIFREGIFGFFGGGERGGEISSLGEVEFFIFLFFYFLFFFVRGGGNRWLVRID